MTDILKIFSAVTLVELAPILTIYVGMLAGFYGLLKFILNQLQSNTDNDRKERQNLALVIEQLAASNREIVVETKKGNKEAEQRNGHLGEQNIEIAKLVGDDHQAIINSLNTISEAVSKGISIQHQNVEEQTIEREIIKGKEK